MAYIQERKTDDGKTHYRVQIRLRGHPELPPLLNEKQTPSYGHSKPKRQWEKGDTLKRQKQKKHTLGELIDRYIENKPLA